ncbi:hypothetical protein PVT68_17420 [Microbulbifer bruguierae]|uniref:Uncharacterized protein n=1 Tax=Microbulbifer bruguierae TaxID=3029061 RepID=A0ABY8NCK1_9GAMM|nr:hypothetical protein [Microbulbifer bruguierae]WGL16528.1 hypothetical protein PVT68_17420 [Microbulbifer bruguierae]
MSKAVIFSIITVFALAAQAESAKSLLSENGVAEATCIPLSSIESKCFVISGNNKFDISKVESANLGKIGVRKRADYSKIISFPSKWLKASDAELMVEITTKAWCEGKQHTLVEPVYIKGGVYLQR